MTERQLPSRNKIRLGGLKMRPARETAEQSAAYSKIVGQLRWFLPALVGFSLLGVFLWPLWRFQDVADKALQALPNLVVEKLNLTGTDGAGRSYVLTADRAFQSGSLKNTLELENPQGEIALAADGWLMGRAQKGRIQQEQKKVWLGGAVELFHHKGAAFVSEEINLDLQKNEAWGEKSVSFQGDFGKIEGSGFRVLKAGDQVLILGPARAKLRLHSLSGADKPSVNDSSSR